MTRAQLERVRAFVALAVRLTAGTTVQGGECLDILDAELAKRYLCTVDAEVIEAESEAEALEAMMERLKLGAVVVSMVEIEGEKQ